MNTLATKNARKYLRELTSGVLHWLHALDTEMKKPSSAERGRRIAAILNALDMANDVAMHYGLGLSFEAINRHKRDGVHAAVRKGSCVSHTRVLANEYRALIAKVRCTACKNFAWHVLLMQPVQYRGAWHHPNCPKVPS